MSCPDCEAWFGMVWFSVEITWWLANELYRLLGLVWYGPVDCRNHQVAD